MPWSAPPFTGGVVWEDAPSQNTPLNAADLNTEENAEAAYAAQVGQSVANYVDAETARATAAEALKLAKASNLSDVADADSSRANLKVPVLRHAQCVSTTNRALSGALPTIDGYAVQDGDRVLLVGQTTASQNGPWIAHVAGWVRPNDYPTGGVLTSRSCKVTGGTVYGATDWLLASTVNVTVDTTAATWKQLQPPPSVELGQASYDLCTRYGASPGNDITALLQQAINDLVTNSPQGGEIYFSKPGTYLLSGAQQTATVLGYTYSGQIVFPAVAQSAACSIRIRGATAVSGNDADSFAGGTVLQSNATSGNVFDFTPVTTGQGVRSGIRPVFEDIVIKCPNDPQCGGIRAMLPFRFGSKNLTIFSGWANGVAPTGSGIALALPYLGNSGDTDVEAQIVGFPVGIAISEHAVLRKVYLGRCGTAIRGLGGGHVNKFLYVDVEECITVFDAPNPGGDPQANAGGMTIEGLLDGENVVADAFAQGAFISEWTNGVVKGVLTLAGTAGWLNGFSLIPTTAGKSVGIGLDLISNTLGTPGWKGRHPSDNFKRNGTVTGNGPGNCSPTLHPWQVNGTGNFSVASQQLKGLVGAGGNYAFLPASKGAVSRTITLVTTVTASGTWVNLLAHCPVSSTGVPSSTANINFTIKNSNTFLNVNNVGVFTGAGVGAGAHTAVVTVIYDALGNPSYVKVYLDGALLTTYALSAAQKTALAIPGNSIYPYLTDGLSIFDLNSYVSSFAVTDTVPDPPYVSSGTSTLVAGTVTIADTKITASSILRVFRTTAGGTLGDLSYSLNAGVGFTINSSAGADTSGVYYEVVSY